MGPTGDDDMHCPIRCQQGKAATARLSLAVARSTSIGSEAKSRTGHQEGCFIEARSRNRREAPHIGFAHRPADLLGDVQQGPHERVDAGTARAVPQDSLKAAVLERSHFRRVPGKTLRLN